MEITLGTAEYILLAIGTMPLLLQVVMIIGLAKEAWWARALTNSFVTLLLLHTGGQPGRQIFYKRKN